MKHPNRKNVKYFVKCSFQDSHAPHTILGVKTLRSVRGLWREYKHALGIKWQDGAVKGSTGVTGICGVIILQANNGGASEALLPLHAPHNAPCPAAACIHLTPHCCMTKAGSPPPGTCQHRSRVEARALMPRDRQGTTRKWSTIVWLVADQHGPHLGSWASGTAARTESFAGVCVEIKMVGVFPHA